jgi:hypothetical protein
VQIEGALGGSTVASAQSYSPAAATTPFMSAFSAPKAAAFDRAYFEDVLKNVLPQRFTRG